MRALSAEDLVPDEPLGTRTGSIGAKDDLLHHRVLAQRTAELAMSSSGNVNVALFGPWGSGKSSFNALLREELSSHASKTQHITFDAWKNAGTGFRTNFLSEVAEQMHADVKISDKLFQSTSSVRGPLTDLQWSKRRRIATLVSFLVGIFLGLPAIWTVLHLILGMDREFPSLYSENIGGFASMAASGTLVVVVVLAVIELSKVTVSKSTPSHVAQFGKLFHEILNTKKNHRFVIFIDELDRCSPDDVMATLEGLRTFLGHPRCVFVVAFDREAIAGVIATKLGAMTSRENAAPYYRTSGEYLDKIFQFQLALPPQPVHTFRRFATSLVRERGGVWAQLRADQPDLLDRVVNILSPMHLASPRRTKVLLNDFAVNARVYEGMGFDWLDRAEEIAVLTVLQTEFPRLAADLEREPALMRFLYGDEVPNRESLHALVKQYSEDAAGEPTPLDEVVGNDKREVAGRLEENLQRYLRLLKERHVPEPRADLIMMHSDGSLLAFNDPGVYHELLSAADMPRKDVLGALSEASEHDLAEAVRYLLDQTEKEAREVSDRLVVLVGEITAKLSAVEPELARLLRGRVSSSVGGMTIRSLQGFGAAAAAAYDQSEMQTILRVASAQRGASVAEVVRTLVISIGEDDWETARSDLLPIVLEHAVAAPDVASAFFVRYSRDIEADIPWDDIDALAASLTAIAPKPVEPASATAAAKAAAEEQDAENDEAYEAQRRANREVAASLASGWADMTLNSEVRRDLLRVFRRVEKGRGFYELHDSLIDRDIERGQVDEANTLLLSAIDDRPGRVARWRDKLDTSRSVSASRKDNALRAILKLVTESSNEATREAGSIAAQTVAELRSDEFDLTEVVELVRSDLATDWDEYSDSRFETQLRLLKVLDILDDDPQTTGHKRATLYLTAVVAAQAEGAAVDILASSLGAEDPSLAAFVATELSARAPWEQDNPELVIRVILAAQICALSGGLDVETLPPQPVAALSEAKFNRPLAAAWLSTAPPVADVERVPNVVTIPAGAWGRFGASATEEQRGEAWQFMVKKQAPFDRIGALGKAGLNLAIYEQMGQAVREAGTVSVRERAVKTFLQLPVRSDAADEVRAMVKVMAQDKKRTELASGVLLLRAYARVLPSAATKSLKPLVSRWAEEGEGNVAKQDIAWLVDHGFATKNSPLWGVVKRIRGRR